ncbi:Na(+)/H(+) antiporter subunit D [Halocatena salina]|uniref:Na(+)/H(+) antiporter subunit D n=1 Tax=Halocatena salina TaxID=2934340 RepID=A0A8U0A3X5_9EURY|nr:Na(+)/H(+) antiporter subunit D [Halocatena salina]UPM43890.1 Na(+)/H(+) antiporter subunit D [Halocatena salina]
MVDPIVPPFVPILAVALIVPFIDRRIGHALGVLATGAVVPYVWLMPNGQHLPAKLFGFDAVLLNVDPFSTLMGIIFAFIGSVAVLYSWASDASSVQTAFALGYVGTSLGAVFGGDWLTLIFFWELMAITSTLLVWYYGGRAVRAGFRYAVLHGIGGTLLLGAVVWQYVAVGSFLFTATAGGLAGDVAPVLAGIGIGVNVGFVGLHAWLPDTYPRPHIAASVFLCVYTTKTGVYGMYRAFPDGQLAIAYMGGVMAVFGAGMALLQSDMRRLLSYHIQSQVGYMIAGVGIGGALATGGAFGHVFNHILYKSLLFMTVGVIIYRTGEESLKKIGGLGRKMPITAITFTIAALSISGFPGFNGFVSKGMVVGAAHKKHLDVLWYLLLAGGVGTFLSFIKLGYSAFVEGTYETPVKDANRGQSVAMILVGGLCVLYGLVPSALFTLLPTTGFEYTTYTIGHVGETLILGAIAVVSFVFLKNPLKRIGRVPDIDRLYNPLTLYGTRGVVLAVTELYAIVDRVVVALTRISVDVVEQPERAVERLTGREHVQLEASIGMSVLLVTLVLVGTFAVLVV